MSTSGSCAGAARASKSSSSSGNVSNTQVGGRVGDEQVGARRAQDLALLCRCEPRVERHARDPRLRAGEVERDRVEPVPGEEADTLDAPPAQHVREPVRELVHLGEAQRVLAAEDRRSPAVTACAAANQLSRGHGPIIGRPLTRESKRE